MRTTSGGRCEISLKQADRDTSDAGSSPNIPLLQTQISSIFAVSGDSTVVPMLSRAAHPRRVPAVNDMPSEQALHTLHRGYARALPVPRINTCADVAQGGHCQPPTTPGSGHLKWPFRVSRAEHKWKRAPSGRLLGQQSGWRPGSGFHVPGKMPEPVASPQHPFQ